MTWQRINKYAMRNGNYQVAKYYVQGKNVYVLWKLPRQWIAKFESFEAAKEYLNELTPSNKTGLDTLSRLRKELAVET